MRGGQIETGSSGRSVATAAICNHRCSNNLLRPGEKRTEGRAKVASVRRKMGQGALTFSARMSRARDWRQQGEMPLAERERVDREAWFVELAERKQDGRFSSVS